MKNFYPAFSLFICCLLTVFSAVAWSHSSGVLTISVEGAYVRETIPGTEISSAYMTLTNTSDDKITLTGASSSRSPRIEIHEHTMSDGMMRMRQRPLIVIKAKETVVLQPSGLHLMIFDLPQPLKQQEMMPLTLHFEGKPDVMVQAPVQGLKKKNNHHHHH